MQNVILVRLNAAEVRRISDHLAAALVMYHQAPSPKDTTKEEEDVGNALLSLDNWDDVDHPDPRGHAVPVLELYDLARIIERATRSPYPWPGDGPSGGRADAAAFAADLRARCHGEVTTAWP